MIDITPEENTFKIKELCAFLSTNEGGEGIIGAHNDQGGLIPFVAADEKRLVSLMPEAKKIAKNVNKKVKLVKFTLGQLKSILYINNTNISNFKKDLL